MHPENRFSLPDLYQGILRQTLTAKEKLDLNSAAADVLARTVGPILGCP